MTSSIRYRAVDAVAASALAPVPAQAEASPSVVRARAIRLAVAQQSDATSTPDMPCGAITINKSWIAEIRF